MMDINSYAHDDVSSEGKGYRFEPNVVSGQDIEPDIHHHLHRGLKSRQVAMIAIGGAIGMLAFSAMRESYLLTLHRNWFDYWHVSDAVADPDINPDLSIAIIDRSFHAVAHLSDRLVQLLSSSDTPLLVSCASS
jgi:hypothetical protein